MTGWKGTTVPNSGTVGKVYLNTNLSNDEIKKICSALTNWDENNYYYVYGVETTGETLVVIKQGESYGIAAMNISTGESTWLFVGAWGENIVNPVIINNKVLSEYNGIQIGTENNKLSSLFSITEFKMIPSSLSEWAKEIADAIREKNGINSPIPHINFAKEIRNIKDDLATTTRILKADYEQKEYSTVVSTVVPNSGQLERIYFNKELSSEEVLEMISWYNLDYFNAGSGYGGTYSYYYVVSDESENIRIQIEYHGGDYIISLYVSDYSETLWRNGVWNEEAEFDFFDLNIQLTNKTNNNRDVGLQNDLLQKMFSITPFGINLEGFCGNIANAIRSRKITTDPINAQNFEEEILSIEPNAKTTDEIFQPTKADIGSSGNVYMNINAYTPEELVQFIDDLVDNKGVTSSSYTIFKNEHYAIEFRTKNSLQSKRQIMILDIDQGRYIQTLFYSTGWNNSIDFTLPILSNITPITNVGEYNYLIENLFTIGENRYRIKVDLDIEPEDLQRIDTVEIVTKTENKVIYAENGIKIFEVDELPTPSLQETGKIYKYQNELFTGIEKPVAYTIGDKLGGSIKFETISDLSGLCNVTNLQQLNLIETPNYYLSIIEVLSLLGLSGIGKCIGVALLDKATQTPVSFAYVYCDMLTVAQFNQTVGSRFGLSISEFGWVTDSIDTKNISEELIENMLDKETLKAFSAIYGVPLTQFVYSSNSTYHFSSNLDEVCYREKEVINIPNTITQISKFAFYYNDNLKKITIPESVTKIGNSAFKYCGALTSIVIPNSVTELGQETFSETGLSNVVLSNNLQELPNGCFSRCVYLKNINIPSGVQAIGASVFKNCSQLKTIVIPSGVTIIGSSAFENCDNLTNVYFTGTQSEWNSIIIESGNEALTSATISFNYAE